MAVAVLATMPAWPDSGPQPPQLAGLGQNDSSAKRPAARFQFHKNSRKYWKLVKCIEKYLLVRKLQMTYQNVQKNMLYIFVLESCMFRQH
jgi:hypothetical protein